MNFASSWSGKKLGEDGEMRIETTGGWLSHMATRAADLLFPRHRRHRPVHYDGREFSAPQLISEAQLPRGPGIYAIQVRHWWYGMKPVHIGSSQNLHEELMVEGHEGFVHWLGQSGSKRGLWVSYHTGDDLENHEAHHREGLRLYRHCFPSRTHSLEEHLATHRIHRTSHHHREVHGHHPTSEHFD
jgi:hypothetical protein